MTGESDTGMTAAKSRFFGMLFAVVVLTIGTVSAQTTFTKKQFDTAEIPYCIAIGDFNGDVGSYLLQDVATANGLDQTADVQYAQNDGDYSVPSHFATGTHPQCVWSGVDVNSDGQADLIVSGTNPTGVSVLLGNGAGGFGAPHFTALPMVPADMDFYIDANHDGKMDIATVDGTTSTIQLLLGHGDGTFSVQALPVPGATQLRSVATSDFNSDGQGDIAVLSCCTGTASAPLSKIYTLLGHATGPYTVVSGITMKAIGVGITSHYGFDSGDTTDIVMSYTNGSGWANRSGVVLLLSNNNGYFRVLHSYGIDPDLELPTTKPVFANLDNTGGLDLALGGSRDDQISSDLGRTSAYIWTWYLNPDGTQKAKSSILLTDRALVAGLEALPRPADAYDLGQDLFATTRGAVNQLYVLRNNGGSGGTTCSAPSSSTGLHLCSPADGSTVSSPVQITAQGGSAVTTIEAWVDGKKVGQASGPKLSLSVSLAAGAHKLTLFAKSNGSITATVVSHFTIN